MSADPKSVFVIRHTRACQSSDPGGEHYEVKAHAFSDREAWCRTTLRRPTRCRIVRYDLAGEVNPARHTPAPAPNDARAGEER